MRVPVALVLLALSLALAACGGSATEEDSGDPSAEIRRMLIVSAKSEDPEDCRRYSTQRALEQVWKEKGPRAVELCEEHADDPRSAVRRVNVSRIEVEDERATAEVGFEGGPSDGQIVELAVVEEEGDWKVDQIERFVKLDRVKAFATMAREWREEAAWAGMLEVAECILGRLAELRDPELEHFFLESSAAEAERFILDCLRQSESDQAI